MTNLYQDETQTLAEFQEMIDEDRVYLEDVIEFKKKYENLATESQVLLKISDRLQRKLDTANNKIQQKNEEITEKNEKLRETIDNLAQARVGKKASTILFTATILLFVSEEIYLGPLVEYFVEYSYLILIFKGVIALSLKLLESILETHFISGEKNRILLDVKEEDLQGEDKPTNKSKSTKSRVPGGKQLQPTI